MAANVQKMPWWAWAFPILASVSLAASALGLVDASATSVLLVDVALLAGTAFAAVHHAEVVAVDVTVIEVALSVSIILSGGPEKAALRATPSSRR